MKCNVCGRHTQNEEANFCDYCGSSFRERFQTPNYMPPKEQGFPYVNSPLPAPSPAPYPSQYKQPVADIPSSSGNERPVTLLNFLGSYGIFFIPIIGWIVFLVMLFVWAFHNNTPTTKKNWARATLIFIVPFSIWLSLGIYALMADPKFQDMINQYNQYFQSLYK